MSDTLLLAAEEGEPAIHIGDHITFESFGLTFHADTIWATAIAGVILLGFGFWMRSKISDRVPSKPQLIWEIVVDAISGQVRQAMGARTNRSVIQLAIALFFFILFCNWLELVPTNHLVPAPTADVNLTYALALLVIVSMHIYSIRQRRLSGYVKHYFQPFPVMMPLNLIEELAKPVSLALRLFGNIFAGGIMLSLIGLLPIWIFWAPNMAWKMFDMFIGILQAVIFTVLTIVYFGTAGETHEEEHHEQNSPEPEAARA